MHSPYTDHYPQAVTIAGEVLGVALSAVVWSRSFRTRTATALFTGAIAIAALLPGFVPDLATDSPPPNLALVAILQLSATLATLAVFLGERRAYWFKALALVGQPALLAVGLHLRESDYELAFLHLFWYGLLVGIHLLRVAPPSKWMLEP